MARIHHVAHAQQRYATVPVLDENGDEKSTPVLRKDGTPKTTKKGREITRRVTVADKSQPQPNHTCGKCHTEIKVGDPYKWVKTKSGPYGGATKYRCHTCPSWRPSELSSSKMAAIYGEQENLGDVLHEGQDVDSLEGLRDAFAQTVREVADEYRESADNIVDGFGHETYQSDELAEKADELEGWADEIDSTEFDSFDDEQPEEGDFEDEDDYDAATFDYETNEESHWDEQREALQNVTDECPV